MQIGAGKYQPPAVLVSEIEQFTQKTFAPLARAAMTVIVVIIVAAVAPTILTGPILSPVIWIRRLARWLQMHGLLGRCSGWGGCSASG